MMNYCLPRREFILRDREQTTVKRPLPPGDDVTAHYRRSKSDSSAPRDHAFSHSCDVTARAPDSYDFYLAVAQEDVETFGLSFCEMVESAMNLKPCLSCRDLPLGGALYETMAETLETKCGGKVVFVVSKNFRQSRECQFLVHFAKTLDPDAKRASLIPLEIDKNVSLPHVLQGLCTINYNAAYREKWLGERLWMAIKGGRRPDRFRSISSSVP